VVKTPAAKQRPTGGMRHQGWCKGDPGDGADPLRTVHRAP
jgi:hypothetical protein